MAGRPIFGTVRYALDEPTEYKDIILSLVGKGKCSWTETQRSSQKRTSRTYTGSEIFVENYISFRGNNPGITAVFPVGTYEYQFTFVLPEDIPPSYISTTGTIKYKIGLKFVKLSVFSINKKFTTTINVYGYVKPELFESNTIFGLNKSLLRPFSKRNHLINLKADIASTFFNPGQNANISFIVTNDTDVKINSVKTELMCYTTYTADCGQTRFETTIIKESTVETLSVPADAVANMESVMQVLAHLYSIQNCRIIKREFKVKVTLRLPMPYINAYVEISIVIGKKRNDRNAEISFLDREMPDPSVEAVAGMTDIPPSYWEAMNEDIYEKEHKEDQEND